MLYAIVRFLKVMFETSITYSMSLIICDFLQLHAYAAITLQFAFAKMGM
jgi:hypothetical protein